MYGPVLAALGASAVLVGAVTGAGEAMALVLRLVFGPVADRTGRYWTLTIVGYGLTAVCVPLLFLAPRLGSAGLAFAVDADPARAARQGRALALEVGAARPRGGRRGPRTRLRGAQGPRPGRRLRGTAARGGRGRRRVVVGRHGGAGDPRGDRDGAAAHAASTGAGPERLRPVGPRPGGAPSHRPAAGGPTRSAPACRGDFFRYAVAASLTTGALVTFGIIGYHLTVDGIVPVAAVPLVYAGAMAVEAVAALARRLGLRPHGRARSCSSCRCSWRWCPHWRSAPPSRPWSSAWSCGDSPTVSRTPRSRRPSPTWSRRRDGPRRTASSRASRACWRSWAGPARAGSTSARCTALVVVVAISQLLALALLLQTFRRTARRSRAG